MAFDAQVDQSKYRRTQIARDQFGRPWAQIIEIATGDPCTGNGLPYEWNDKLRTPNQFIRVPRDSGRRPIPGRCHISFEEWIPQLEQDLKDWRRYLMQVGKFRYKKTTPQEIKEWETDDYLLEDAGPKPGGHLEQFLTEEERDDQSISTVLVLERAQAGDEFLLSLNEIEGLEAPTEITWPMFMAEGKKAGKSLEELSVLWAIQKAEKAQELKDKKSQFAVPKELKEAMANG
jgi:hypothetical protein